MQEAKQKALQGDIDAAIVQCNYAIKAAANQGEIIKALQRRGVIYGMRESDYWLGLEDLTRVIDHDPKNANAYLAYAEICRKLKLHELSLKYTAHVLGVLDKNNAAAWVFWGANYFDLGYMEMALWCMRKAISINNENLCAHEWAVDICVRLKNYDAAIEYLGYMQNLTPNLAQKQSYQAEIDELSNVSTPVANGIAQQIVSSHPIFISPLPADDLPTSCARTRVYKPKGNQEMRNDIMAEWLEQQQEKAADNSGNGRSYSGSI